MDLARRRAAGELAALLGKDALPEDRKNCIHEFRQLAKKVLAALPAEQRSLLEAYASGVNSGLSALASKPFEYVLLRTEPAAWAPEDSLLVIYAEALTLESANISFERSLATVNDNFGKSATAYFAPLVGPEDAALDDTSAELAPMPSERLIDIRKRVYEYEDHKKHAALGRSANDAIPGSNAFALAGSHTRSKAGILANDIHRDLAVPNQWYRAALSFSAGENKVRVTGITLPGLPLIIAGSNGHVAWGLTNACADVADLVVMNPAAGPGTYMDQNTPRLYEQRVATLQVRGGKPETFEYSWTQWGPVIGTNPDKRDLVLKWTMHDPSAVNLSLMELETSATAADAVEVAHRAGIPAQNIVIADASGAIAWTTAGLLPKRYKFDGRLPTTWAFGDRKWIGFLAPSEVPTSIEPASGLLWSANQRMAGGASLEALGDGGYAFPYRAARIRDDLNALELATPKELLAVQLDAHVPMMERWQKLLLAALGASSPQNRDREQMRAALENWTGEASVDSASYRLVSAFRQRVVERVMPVVFEPCYDVYPDFDFSRFNYEPALWDMVQKRPPHLLAQEYGSWDDLFSAAIDDVIAEVKKEHGAVKAAQWGRHNRADIQHPLARCFPGPLGWWLKMPTDPLAGDLFAPRTQSPRFGASERFVVEPGHEADGIFEMPGGQSGNPLSPFFRAGHDAWVKGEPTAFLPGPTAHTLSLEP
jgi:penicillin amidase